MGYDLNITRSENWHDEDEDPILWEEWTRLIEDDPDLEFSDTDFVGERPLAVWIDGRSACWLMWSHGHVTSKYPDDELVEKMIELADKLDAIVQGDDGETYPESDNPTPIDTGTHQRTGCLSVFFVIASAAFVSIFAIVMGY